MKLSVSLSDQDVAILDEFARSAGLPTRSAAVQQAIRNLAAAHLEDDYEAAWDDWEASGDDARWGVTVGDGVPDAAR